MKYLLPILMMTTPVMANGIDGDYDKVYDDLYENMWEAQRQERLKNHIGIKFIMQ